MLKVFNMKKYILTIGIPAFNESANIKKLLESLLKQQRDNFILKEIIVVSDCSTDNTIDEVKSVKSKQIKLLMNKKRLGQAAGQNKIVKQFNSDILVLLNADILPANNHFLSELIKPFFVSDKVGLVGAKIIPIKGKNFFEKVINYSINFKDTMFERWHNGDNLYLCSGRARAFKKGLAKRIYWKDSLSEDAFPYFLCKQIGYKFKYDPAAKIYFKCPENFRDHIKQSARFTQGPRIMRRFFKKDLVTKEYKTPKKIAVVTIIQYMFRNPILFLSYVFIMITVKLNPRKRDFVKSTWEISKSSKVLHRNI